MKEAATNSPKIKKRNTQLMIAVDLYNKVLRIINKIHPFIL
jgi:hypothetical protein